MVQWVFFVGSAFFTFFGALEFYLDLHLFGWCTVAGGSIWSIGWVGLLTRDGGLAVKDKKQSAKNTASSSNNSKLDNALSRNAEKNRDDSYKDPPRKPDIYKPPPKQRYEEPEEIEEQFNAPSAYDPMPTQRPQSPKLENMIGLAEVKEQVAGLADLVRAEQHRRKLGMPASDLSFHLAFTGNPGTGKTTVAQAIGQIYRDVGLLKSGHVVAVDRKDLVASYVGQTAGKTQEQIDKAMGGILFIDEAYNLYKEDSENDFGKEALETVMIAMENKRGKFIVIIAGYTREINQLLQSNPGLRSRFSRHIEFPDYSAEELVLIYKGIADTQRIKIEPAALKVLESTIQQMVIRKTKHFGNAREIRNLYQKTLEQQAKRLRGSQHGVDIICAADIPKA